ncbi:28 kDa heat- and acid-stable phosphoprotein isoform 1 [Corchorus capsularis]|uniref:28 kDa heat-and acid-stable phosphoprotein isoform 1 n=1 Tax=Corchorus capsularis TaxID=210143 RepID=A0A1R3K6E8_COCAP|nr:28 kDa heat- and acid-stable phosphoprotein isoform 1 [Corchorus capsularis]
MARGKTKPKRTGQHTFSSIEEILAGTSSRPPTFTQREAKYNEEEESKRGFRQESEEESDNETEQKQKHKGIQERLALIRQEREEAAKKREEEKAVKEQRKAEARK